MKTNTEMNEKIVELLRIDESPCSQYAATRIEELERENARLRNALRKIANADYRGNRHPLSVEAFIALSNNTPTNKEDCDE